MCIYVCNCKHNHAQAIADKTLEAVINDSNKGYAMDESGGWEEFKAGKFTYQHTLQQPLNATHTATHSNALQHTAIRTALHTRTHWNTLQHIETECGWKGFKAGEFTLQHTLQHSVQHKLQHTRQHTLQHTTTHTALLTATHCNAHCITNCNTLQHPAPGRSSRQASYTSTHCAVHIATQITTHTATHTTICSATPTVL